MNAAEFFRALDDSDLDPYECRFLMRVWRRGKCWEKLAKISQETGMSIGKASEVRRALLAKGWLMEAVHEDRIVFQVALPDCCSVSRNENEIHYVKPEFHEVKPNFHQVGALPFNSQKEDLPIKYISAPGEEAAASGDEEAAAKLLAWQAIVGLIEFWEQLTKRNRPPQNPDAFRDSWLKPFNEIWIACGRDTATAKAKIQAVRNDMLAQGLTILDPAKLPGHVQTMIDRELLPMTARMNGNGSGHVNLKNDPDAREAHNRAVFDQVAQEIESGEWSPWTI